MAGTDTDTKLKTLHGKGRGSALAQYRRLVYGDRSWAFVLRCELTVLLFGGIPGALGLALRSVFYRGLFRSAGRKVVFGRHLTLRHPHKIELGEGCVLDDDVVLDAKGETNRGIRIGRRVYLGRHTIVYTKNGDIELGDDVNLSSNCQVFSSNALTIGAGAMIGAYSYVLSGGEYDANDPAPFAAQSGTCTKGPLTIGPDCWFGARVTVLDAACIGRRCVIGAGAVVTKPVPDFSVALGVPARVVRTLPGGGAAESAPA